MAEWMEVMRQWRRMCDKHTCSRNNSAFTGTGLPICPIAAEHEGDPCNEDPIDWTEKATKQFEEIVTTWAAEHPEPVYPTWGEWLISVGAARKIPTSIPFELQNGRIVDSPWETVVAVDTPIPADTAQNLGIEPKEGT